MVGLGELTREADRRGRFRMAERPRSATRQDDLQGVRAIQPRARRHRQHRLRGWSRRHLDARSPRRKEGMAGMVRGEPGATFDNAAKNALIATGRDSLFQTLDRANWAWHNGLNVSNPLPSPDLTITEGANRISLEWTDMAARYSNVRHTASIGSAVRCRMTPMSSWSRSSEPLRMARCGRTARAAMGDDHRSAGLPDSYVDLDVIRGEPYYYAVTVVDNGSTNTGLVPGPLESSRFTNRSQQPAVAFQPGEGLDQRHPRRAQSRTSRPPATSTSPTIRTTSSSSTCLPTPS
jgi:hypothetical protein